MLVLRSSAGSAALTQALTAAGAEVVTVALQTIKPPDDRHAFDRAVTSLAYGEYEWVAFTSANAVRAVDDCGAELILPRIVTRTTKVAAVGAATAAALSSVGVAVDLQPPDGDSSADGLADRWPAPAGANSRVLLPTSSIGLPTLAEALTDRGYLVDRVIAYRPQPLPLPDSVAEDVAAGRFSAILLRAPSLLRGLTAQVSPPAGVVLGCIGPTTATAVAAAGLPVGYIAERPTAAAMVAGLVAALTRIEGDSPRTAGTISHVSTGGFLDEL